MRSIKKIAALVLAFAMLATMFAFSASAETKAANLYLEGPANATVGAVYTVSIRLSDEGNLVGGFSGTLKYEGATFVKTEVHPSVLELNDTDKEATVITKDKDKNAINFVTVTRVDGNNTTNPTNAIWFKVSFMIDSVDASFSLSDVKFSDKEGKALLSETGDTADDTKAPTVTVKNYAINTIQMKDTDDAKTQGFKYGVSFPDGIPAGATEYGVVFYPTSLLNGATLTTTTNGAVVAKVISSDPNFNTIVGADGKYYAYLNFNFTDEAKAYQFLGTKISARAYYIDEDGKEHYSTNTNNIGVEDGVADKAILNVAKEAAAKVETNKSERVSDDQLAIALKKLDDATDYATYRGQLLQYVVDNFDDPIA